MPAAKKLGQIAALFLTVAALSACGGAQSRMAKHMDKGRQFLAAENYDKARVEFQNALQIMPLDAEARFESGVVAEKLGKTRDAAGFYQGTIDVSPEHIGAHTNLARLYLFSGNPDKALELIQPTLDKHPDDPELLTVRAAVREQKKDNDGALVDAQRAVELAPGNEDAVAVLAGLYSSSGNLDKAQAVLETAIAKLPQTLDLRVALAEVYARENRPADCEAVLNKLIELKPADKSNRLRLAQYYARMKQPEAAERALREAIKAIPNDDGVKIALVEFLTVQQGREAAEAELRRMVAANPDDSQLQFSLASFYESSKQAAEAEKVYQGVIDRHKLDTDGLVARDHLAELYMKRGDDAKALDLIGQVLAKSPRDDDALLLRGNMALTKQDPRSAIADLRAVLRDQPNAVGVLRILARAHMANGEPAVAEETMRHAFEANPTDAGVELDFAQLLIGAGKPEQAKPVLAALLKQQPNNLQALDTSFRASLATNDLSSAQATATTILALQPKAAAGYYFEGLVAEAQQHTEEALKLYAQAVDNEPNSMEPLQAQIRTLVAMKRIPEALKRADEISQREPKAGLGPQAKGELLLSQHRLDEAEAAFNEARSRAPSWWMPYHGLAAVKSARKDSEAAMLELKNGESAASAPDRLEIELASMYEVRGGFDEAIGEYEAALKHNPQSDVAINNLAMLLASHRTDQASLDRAKLLASRFAESNNPSFMDTYGWVLYKRGEATASVPVLERVVAKVPNEPVALYHLGMAQVLAGSSSEARINLTRAVQSGAKFPGLDEAKATLDKIARLPQSASNSPPQS